ncbi:MAG: heliorhodopsin HeR [bacterium]|nr:heliorhodopsin HeR [bacterium]
MAEKKRTTRTNTTKKRAAKSAASKKTVSKKRVVKKSSAKLSTKKTTAKRVSKKSTKQVAKKTSVKTKVKEITYASLHKWNKALFVLHGLQAAAITYFAYKAAFTVEVTTNFLTVDPAVQAGGQGDFLISATRTLFDVNLGYLVAAFFVMSAVAHLLIATSYRKTYEANLEKGLNKARWAEYSLSASTMMVAIALLSGVYDASTLILIFVATAIMNLMGLLMEVHNQSTKVTNWLSYKVGVLAGVLPWLVVGIYFLGANIYGAGNIPTFVYAIYGTLFAFFNVFAINMYLQYKKKGKWANYLYGERTYMILSLVAKSALAWQVFTGVLQP